MTCFKKKTLNTIQKLITMKAKMNIKGMLSLVLLMMTFSLSAQQHSVTGTVVDADNGQPLVGVAVMVSTGGGTTTDINGAYAVQVSDDATLTFSTLGFLDVTEKVNGRSVVNVKMTVDQQLLDEVVVLGYTSQKKNELSSSVVTVSAEKLKDVTTADLGNMLQGKAAGVLVMNASGQPGDGAKIRIRGTGSITAGAGPLYVVDGVAGGSFNPNDVETLTVLKDASATALYGASASGGVIVVTTKQAKSDKATVTFKATAGIKKALSGRFKPMDSQELFDYHKSFYPKALFAGAYPESLLEKDFDWMNAVFKIGVVQDYYASAAGKTGRTNWFASISHYDEEGTLISTNHSRSSARLNLSAPIGDKVNFAVRLNYDRSRREDPSYWQTLYNSYLAMPWDIPYVYDAEGNLTDEILYVSGAKRPDNGEKWRTDTGVNILHNEQYNYNLSESEEIVADVQLNWNITDWLLFTSTNRFNSASWFNESYIDPRTAATSKNGEISNSISTGWGFGTTNLLKANKTFGDHAVNGVVGLEYGEGFSRATSVGGTGMPAGQASISNSIVAEGAGYNYKSRSWAWLAQAQYSYKGKYIVTGSIRYDETSRFAPKARGGYFPGVSAAWLINEEEWMKNQSVVSLLKIRAGYGKTGNNTIEEFLYQDVYSLSVKYQDVIAAMIQRNANPNLGWEEAYMTSLGIEAEFLNRFNLIVDLYNIDNKNLLLAVPLAPSTGFFEFMSNVGTVNNKGVEIAVDADIFNKRDFGWNVGFNIGFNKNEVVELPNGEFRQGSQIVRQGYDIFTWNMPKWAGVDIETGKPLWEVVNEETGEITTTSNYAEASYQDVGTSSPRFQGGLNTSLRWKGFTLSATGNFIYGNLIYNTTREIMDSDGGYVAYNQMSLENGLGWKRWVKGADNTNVTHPEAKFNGNNKANSLSSRYLEDGSYFRLKNVTLSYDFPQAWMKKAKMQGLRLYVSGDNLWTVSKFSGMDPEIDTESGEYNNNYPVPMTVVGGIQITF